MAPAGWASSPPGIRAPALPSVLVLRFSASNEVDDFLRVAYVDRGPTRSVKRPNANVAR